MLSISSTTPTSHMLNATKVAPGAPQGEASSPEFRDAFNQFVGQTLFGEMLKSMRATVGKPAYFHGGRAEEMFTQQLDQHLAEKMSKTAAEKFSKPMLDLYNLQRR